MPLDPTRSKVGELIMDLRAGYMLARAKYMPPAFTNVVPVDRLSGPVHEERAALSGIFKPPRRPFM